MVEPTAALWADAIQDFPADGAIFLSGCTGEPTAFLDALNEDPEIGRGREFRGVWLPGINRFDPTSAANGTTATTIFATNDLQEGIDAGRVRVVPLHYSSCYRWFRSGEGIAGGVFQVARPRDGSVGLGISADFAPALIDAGVPVVGQVNPEMPDAVASPRIPVGRFSTLIEAPDALVEHDPGMPSETLRRIAHHVASLIRPGDTVQLGLGKLQRAVVDALSGAADLGLHGGMVSDAVLDAVGNGGFRRGVTAGVALGSRSFYDQVATDPRFRFVPVPQTHDAAVLRSLPNFVSVNSVLEVDLFGQCNGEFLGERQITGHGGLVDFARGANASEGGRSIIALPSTAGEGRSSRIVPRLCPSRPVTLARSDVQWVVTEHGAANLAHADTEQRAERILNIADPAFRDGLADGWAALHNRRTPA